MTIAESIPDAISFAKSLGDLCLFVAILGCVFTLVACACVYSFSGDDTAEPAAQPPVTVLKPLHDTEPGLPARLAAFCRQDYGAPVQVLCGVRDRASPAAAVVQSMEVDSPDRRIELLAEPRSHGVNRKVSNLINMMPRARYDTLVLSDSDIVVGPNYLRAVTALLASPRVGAVTCLYYGVGDEGLWTRLSALAINTQFLPRAVTVIRHQIRVARTIKSIDPIGYAGTIITHPWPLALLALALGSPAATLVAVAVLLSRVMLCRCVEWRFDLPRQNYWLIPLQDIVGFGIYVTSFFGATVHWRGADYRVTADGTLLEGQDLRGS